MDHRIGKCSDCGAEYKIPASFPHDVARCKVCSGVVRLGPPGGPPPAAEAPKSKPMPARKVSPAPAAQQEAPKKKKGDTLARLRAQRGSSEGAEAPAPNPKAAARSAAPKRAAAKAGSPEKPTRKSAAAKPAGGARRKSGAAKAEGSKAGRRAPRREPKPKKSPVVGIIGIVVLLAIIAGVYFFKDQLMETGATDEVVAQDSTVVEEAPAEVEVPEVMEPEPEPEPEPEVAPEPVEKVKKVANPDDIDLTVFEDFGPADETTDDEWDEMTGWMATWMDPDAGAAGNRAKIKLLKKKRNAFPVILNAFKRFDFATEDGKSNGDQCQAGLGKILNGKNFEWRYTTAPEDVYYNKGVVRNYCMMWQKAADDIGYWINTTSMEERDPEEAQRLRDYQSTSGGVESTDSGDDDDLDVD